MLRGSDARQSTRCYQMKYRADIDGLRAVAVLLVILFHFGVPGFSGGFIGVDVFFVLSGYLIGSIVFSQLQDDKFSFSQFYFRRIRRLFPVYVVVIFSTFVLAWWVLLPGVFREFGQSLLASSVYLSNVLFFREAGYFDASAELKPLLHTWSLSVEEQFYLIFPALAWIVARLSKRRMFILFAMLTAFSVVASAIYIERDASAVFYLYPFRAWEMFIGTMLAVGYIPQVRSAAARNALSLIGLSLIVVPALLYDDATLFPGLAAIPPCLGTALLIHAGAASQGAFQNSLGSAGPVLIGKMSYSLYLWHWPLLVLYQYSQPEELGAGDIAIVGAATIIASALSWKFVEIPFRSGRISFSNSKPKVFVSTALISAACIALGLHIHFSNGMPNRLDAETLKFAQAADDLFGDLSDCTTADNDNLPGIEHCTLGNPLLAEDYVLVWGDSHAGAYKAGIASVVDAAGTPVLIAWTGGCPPVFDTRKDESVASMADDDHCFDQNERVRRLIETDERIAAVVLVGRWSYYLNGSGVGVDDGNTIRVWPSEQHSAASDQAGYFVEALHDTLTELSHGDHELFVVEQAPEFSNYQARALAISLMKGRTDEDASVARLTLESYASVTQRQGAVQTVLNDAESANLATILRTHEFFCDAHQCSLMLDGYPAYFDNNHVSSSGARQMNRMFSPLVRFLGQTGNATASR